MAPLHTADAYLPDSKHSGRESFFLFNSVVSFAFAGVLLFTSGCATVRPQSELEGPDAARAMVERFCSARSDVKTSVGNLWIQARTPDASGQFPASVKATRSGDVELEIVDLIGSKIATLIVRGESFELKHVQNSARSFSGSGEWNAIPVRWLNQVFLGRTPCPDASEIRKGEFRLIESGVVEGKFGKHDRVIYRYDQSGAVQWVTEAEWWLHGQRVQFTFDDIEFGSGAPMKWSVKSSLGEIKARWKQRDLTR